MLLLIFPLWSETQLPTFLLIRADLLWLLLLYHVFLLVISTIMAETAFLLYLQMSAQVYSSKMQSYASHSLSCSTMPRAQSDERNKQGC